MCPSYPTAPGFSRSSARLPVSRRPRPGAPRGVGAPVDRGADPARSVPAGQDRAESVWVARRVGAAGAEVAPRGPTPPATPGRRRSDDGGACRACRAEYPPQGGATHASVRCRDRVGTDRTTTHEGVHRDDVTNRAISLVRGGVIDRVDGARDHHGGRRSVRARLATPRRRTTRAGRERPVAPTRGAGRGSATAPGAATMISSR